MAASFMILTVTLLAVTNIKIFAFTEAIQKGVPYISDVLFDKDGKASIFFAAPIRDKDQKILGVLRMSYDASILQDTIKANTSAVGLLSYPVLYDENQFRLGDAYSSFYLYTFVAPLSDAKLADAAQRQSCPRSSSNYVSNKPDRSLQPP